MSDIENLIEYVRSLDPSDIMDNIYIIEGMIEDLDEDEIKDFFTINDSSEYIWDLEAMSKEFLKSDAEIMEPKPPLVKVKHQRIKKVSLKKLKDFNTRR